MALYKRYIPGQKASQASDVAKDSAQQHAAPLTGETKRKRDRSDNEVAERKAKKLKKKGITTTTHDTQNENVDITNELEDVENDTPVPSGQFSHIKSAKKRHKLEKEARKARKVAQKQDIDIDRQETGDFAEEVPQEEQQTVEDPDSVTTKKKTKKKQKIKHEDDDAEEKSASAQDTSINVDDDKVAEQSTDAYDVTLSQPKKRRHKLEHILAENKAHGLGISHVDDEDDGYARKHASVLSKFQQSKAQAEARSAVETEPLDDIVIEDKSVVKDLVIPERAPTPEFDNSDSALPKWLANPTIVSTDDKASFSELGLAPDTVKHLSGLGFTTALPVQKVLLPLLIPPTIPGSAFRPGTELVLPDLAVGAPTGSGKTLAYLLPIIESLRRPFSSGRLSALIVVPTRELVMQVAAVAESLSKGSGIKVGMATASSRFKDEQDRLIRRGRRYDPSAYRKLMERADRRSRPPAEDSEEFQQYVADLASEEADAEQRLRIALECLVDHVPTYDSAVNILVATPGRLLEHINSTVGFSLNSLSWLVLDEADKLLDNEYEGFLDALMHEIERKPRPEEEDGYPQYLHKNGVALRSGRTRKVVLSATMTRDISKLTLLRLAWPRMVVVRGFELDNISSKDVPSRSLQKSISQTADEFELPPTLTEYCVPVGDGSEKPLVALELLRQILKDEGTSTDDETKTQHNASDTMDDVDDDNSSTSDVSDDSSDLSSEDSDSSSDESSVVSDDGEDDGNDDRSSTLDNDQPSPSLVPKPARLVSGQMSLLDSTSPAILVFTSSTQSATRLSHLLTRLAPAWSRSITTLTKTSKSTSHRLSRIPSDQPILVIATDRAARGLDTLGRRTITHVVQYDVPTSVAGYVHRVGRTARAGRSGEAWTLYTHGEARWFQNEIVKAGGKVRRRGPVERVKLFMKDEQVRSRYTEVLADMRDEVHGNAKD